jgi:hypothetical protein
LIKGLWKKDKFSVKRRKRKEFETDKTKIETAKQTKQVPTVESPPQPQPITHTY